MKQLPDFDLSIVVSVSQSLAEFERFFLPKAKYFERNGIEVIVVVNKPIKQEEILSYICAYPFICWKVVINNKEDNLRNPAKAFNVGIRQATKKYLMVMEPNVEFYSDVIYLLREKLDFYPEHYAIGQVLFVDINEEVDKKNSGCFHSELIPFGSIMTRKEYFEKINGYNESYTEGYGEDEYLRKRLELSGIRLLFFPESILIYRKNVIQQTTLINDQQIHIMRELSSEMLLPLLVKVNEYGRGTEFYTVVYDWKDHPYAKEQCRKYLSTFKQFDINSDEIFNRVYSLIALIPTYNESEYIKECLRSVEKYCDGIIVLDDDSIDNTYQIVESDKLLVKAKKERICFDDKQNRNMILDIASFFKTEWFIFIDADERFYDRFMNLNDLMKLPVDTIGIWIANLWDDQGLYRINMPDTHSYSQNGLWFRWRMFRNKGRMQILGKNKLHFNSVPYVKNIAISETLFLHIGYLNEKKRSDKYEFYMKEDLNKMMDYDSILSDDIKLRRIDLITKNLFVIK